MSLKEKNTVRISIIIFCVLFFVHGFEAVVLRTNETIFGENFINKLFGILLLFAVLHSLKWTAKDIGFTRTGAIKHTCIGLLLAAVSFLVSYGIEIIILTLQGHTVNLGVFVAGFSLTGEAMIHTGLGFILMCVFFNIINVIMEEGTFRGLIYQIARTDHSERFAILFQALLFGIWHIAEPLHNLIDGDIDMASFLGLSLGYIILAGVMGIKWGLMYRMTGTLYAGMADHFVNNCIATNLVHTLTENGTDELLIVRVLIAQLLSFIAVIVVYRKKAQNEMNFRKEVLL